MSERIKVLEHQLAKAQAALGDAQADLRAVKCGHATPKEARLERELAKARAENARLRGALGTAIELLDRYSAAVHCLSIDREPEVEEQVSRLRGVWHGEKSEIHKAIDKARGGPTPPKEYQGFA